MTKLRTALKSAALGVFALGAMSGGAYAGSASQPGASIGGAPGAPAPEGLYFIDNLNFGNDRVNTHDLFAVEIPVIAWSTGYKVLGGNLSFAATVPSIYIDNTNGTGVPGNTIKELVFTQIGASIAWNLGSGLFVQQGFTPYLPGAGGQDGWIPEGRTGISFLGLPTWNFSANLIYGFPQKPGNSLAGVQANDYFNVDFAAIKTIGKWELGFVGFASTDTNITATNIATGKQSQVAVGGLVGYNWGPVTTQFYYTHDVEVNHYGPGGTKGVEDSRVWTQLIVPLWNAPKESYK
jgi:hypothetical protein